MRAPWSPQMAVPALALGVLALAVAASGAAGSVKRAGGIAYVTKSFERDAGYAKLKARCPRDTHVLSGGTDNNAPFNQAALHHSYPVDARDKGKQPDDGWKVEVTGSDTYTFRVYAICADRRVKYVKRSLAANGGMSQTNLVVDCPGSLAVVGGGHRGPRTLSANSGFPEELNDLWAFFVDNQSNEPLPLTGYAQCVRFPVAVQSEANNETPANAQTFVEAECLTSGSKFVIGGGLSNGGGWNQIGVNATFPGGFAGPPKGSWSVWTDNRTAATISVSAHAVCAPSLR